MLLSQAKYQLLAHLLGHSQVFDQLLERLVRILQSRPDQLLQHDVLRPVESMVTNNEQAYGK